MASATDGCADVFLSRRLHPAQAEAPTPRREEQAALNQPMPHLPQPYRPPVDDGDSAEQVVTRWYRTGTIPLPTPQPAT